MNNTNGGKTQRLKNYDFHCFGPVPPTSFLQSLLFFLLTIIYRKTNTSSDNESQLVVQQVTTGDNDLSFQLTFLFFRIREEPTTKHPKETSLNLEEDLQKRLLN